MLSICILFDIFHYLMSKLPVWMAKQTTFCSDPETKFVALSLETLFGLNMGFTGNIGFVGVDTGFLGLFGGFFCFLFFFFTLSYLLVLKGHDFLTQD